MTSIIRQSGEGCEGAGWRSRSCPLRGRETSEKHSSPLELLEELPSRREGRLNSTLPPKTDRHLKEGGDFWLSMGKMVLVISLIKNGKVLKHHDMLTCLVCWGLSVLKGRLPSISAPCQI